MGPHYPSRERDDPSGDDSPRDEGSSHGPEGEDHSSEAAGSILRGSSSREILERLIDGDPLELEARCEQRMELCGYLLDLGRLHLRAVARIARAASQWNGHVKLDDFLLERIDYSMEELIQEDREAELSGIPCADEENGRYAFLAETLGIPHAMARRACVAFNYLPTRVRCAYFAIMVLGKSINRHVAEGNGPPDRVKADVERAVRTISEAIGRGPSRGEGMYG